MQPRRRRAHACVRANGQPLSGSRDDSEERRRIPRDMSRQVFIVCAWCSSAGPCCTQLHDLSFPLRFSFEFV